jgi:hypothetical protein
MDEVGVVLAARAMELRQAPKRSSAPGSLAHPHAIGFAAGTVEGIASRPAPSRASHGIME